MEKLKPPFVWNFPLVSFCATHIFKLHLKPCGIQYVSFYLRWRWRIIRVNFCQIIPCAFSKGFV